MNIGDRVRIAPVPYMIFRANTGTIIADDYDGYWMVELDEPGYQVQPDGTDRDCPVVVEHEEGLTVLDVSRPPIAPGDPQ